MVSIFKLPNGAQMGYNVLGGEKLGSGMRPLVIVNGMSMRFEDWDVISIPLSKSRPVLLFDHRDIGSSIVSTSQLEPLSIALMAADAIALVKSLGWKEVDMMGYSMGGSILQELLIQPPPSLPFVIKHAVLAATTTKAPHGDPEFLEVMMRMRAPRRASSASSSSSSSSSSGAKQERKPLLKEERLKVLIEQARPLTELGYDKQWLSIPANRALVEAKLPNMVYGRPARIIAQQGAAVGAPEADHRSALPSIPSSIQVLVLHGKLDRMISYKESDYIVRGIAHARRVPISAPGTGKEGEGEGKGKGRKKGTLPSDVYGHTWYDYFTPAIWDEVITCFLDDVDVEEGEGEGVKAKL